MLVRMIRRFERGNRIIPAGWSGDLPDALAKAAVADRAAVEVGSDGQPVKAKPAKAD